eukprot:Sspe_Gene.80684::Locus_51059_Transcript_1_1_Confidence_1.000_Length_1067::g.80684::m.80684
MESGVLSSKVSEVVERAAAEAVGRVMQERGLVTTDTLGRKVEDVLLKDGGVLLQGVASQMASFPSVGHAVRAAAERYVGEHGEVVERVAREAASHYLGDGLAERVVKETAGRQLREEGG